LFDAARVVAESLSIADGRRFGCTRCGNCCVEDGFVYMTHAEARRMAKHLELSVGEFWNRYDLRWDEEADSVLVEAKDGRGCPLLTKERGCSVHPVKPGQCQQWPFWSEMLDEAAEWNKAKRYCPGLDAPDGRLYPRDEIVQIRRGAHATDENKSR